MKKKFIFQNLSIIVLGGLTSLSLPPYNFFLINFFTFSIFFGFLLKKLNTELLKKKFFYYGWLFGFGYFSTNLYWISISLTFDENFIFLIPITLILIPSFISIFYGIITLLFYLLKPKNIISAFFMFSLLFGGIEFLRGIVLTGFPWNLIVYSLSKNLEFISIISIIGTYSLNLIVISFFTLPALFVLRKSKKEIGICIILVILPILFLGYGNFQKREFLTKDIKKNPYTIRIIASNISLDRFYNNIQTETVIEELITISSPDKNKKTFFLWPEGIIPNTYQDEMHLYRDMFLKNFDENHLIGLGITKRELKNNQYKYYNNFSVFNGVLDLQNDYDKNKLVPFGEFLPLEFFLNKVGFKTITSDFGSFTKGTKRNIIEITDRNYKFSFLPLICYEIIYSGNLSKNFNFDFIINISEDGWFGNSVGPKQHFSHSIFRAIESGKYVIRSANNGMAAIINPLGEIEQKVEYGVNNYIDFEKKRDSNKTFFSNYGNLIFLVLILLYIFLTISFNRIRDE